jgi:hypothetical protein
MNAHILSKSKGERSSNDGALIALFLSFPPRFFPTLLHFESALLSLGLRSFTPFHFGGLGLFVTPLHKFSDAA